MNDDLRKMSSEQIAAEINNVQIDEGQDVEPESDAGEIEQGEEISKPDIDGARYIEEKGRYEFPREYANRVVNEKRERERQEAEREREEQIDRDTKEYLKKRGNGHQAEVNPIQFQESVNQAMVMDAEEMKDKYGKDIVEEFGRDYLLGRIKMPEDLDDGGGPPHEEMFLKWFNEKSKKGMSSSEIKRIVDSANEGPKLRSRTLEVGAPDLVRPSPNRKTPKRTPEKRFKVPTVTETDMKEFLQFLYEKHPERFE